MLKYFDMVKKSIFIFLIVGLIAGCSGGEPSNTTSENQENIPPLLKRPESFGSASDFTTVKIGGGEFKLSSLQGKVILLNFWAVGCGICKMQIPILVELYKQYNSEGLEVVGVCLDRESIAKSYAGSMHMEYTLVLVNREIANKYREVRGIPMTFIIDRQGNILEKHIGYTTKSKFEEEIKKLLNNKDK